MRRNEVPRRTFPQRQHSIQLILAHLIPPLPLQPQSAQVALDIMRSSLRQHRQCHRICHHQNIKSLSKRIYINYSQYACK